MLMKFSLSTQELMRLVVLTAFSLALFQGAWKFVVFPPITMLAAILNLTLYWTWVRRKPLTRAFYSSVLVGLAMALAIGMYMAATALNPTIAMRLLKLLPESAERLLLPSLLGSRWTVLLDFALLDLLGFGSMIGSGWLVAAHERSRRLRSVRSIGRSS
jgi:hypothetical protein